jgi:type IV secretion system protein VirB8
VSFGVAGAGWLCAAAMALTLMRLMPLKRVDPFVIRVDNSTGVVDVVPVFVGQTAMPEAVTRYFLNHYVTVCERFEFGTAESDYEECGAFHTAVRNQQWMARWTRSNPASPLNVYKDGSSLRAEVSAVSFFERASGVTDLAQVRYTQAKRSAGASVDQVTHWIATVQYTYGDPSTDPKVRRWNPLGFKIVEFRSEPEVPTDTATTTASTVSTVYANSAGVRP